MSRSNRPEDYLNKPGAVKLNRSIPVNRWTWVRFPYIVDMKAGHIIYQWHLYDFTIKWDIKYYKQKNVTTNSYTYRSHGYRMMNWVKCGIKGNDEETEFLRKGKCPPGMKDVCPKCREIWTANWKKPVFKEKIDDDPEAWYNLE